MEVSASVNVRMEMSCPNSKKSAPLEPAYRRSVNAVSIPIEV